MTQVYDQLGNLVGVSELPINSTLIFSHSAIDRPLYIRSGANSINWSYRLNTQSTPTIGGEVVQILSCFVGPITIEGLAAGFSVTEAGGNKYTPAGYGPGAFTPTDEMSMIVLWFLEYMHKAGGGRKRRIEEAVTFSYPARDWTFHIQPTDLQGFDIKKTNVGQPWSITAEVVDDPGLDYFVAETMSQYTDSLTSRASLQVAISPGFEFAANPFTNPWLNTGVDASTLAARIGDNFQALVAAWAYGDFNVFNGGFSSLADPKRQTGVDNPYDYYSQLVGGTYIGDAAKIKADYNAAFDGGAGTGGSSTITGDTSAEQWMKSLFKCLGVPEESQQNSCFMKSWAGAEGGHVANANKFNWLNHVFENQQGATPRKVVGRDGITRTFAVYDTEANGVLGLCNFLKKSKYSDIVDALRAGNPLDQWPDNGLQTWIAGSSHGPESAAYSNKIKTRTKQCVDAAAAQLVSSYDLGPVIKGGTPIIHVRLTHWTSGVDNSRAVDIIANPGTPVYAPEDMNVTYIGGSDGGTTGESVHAIGKSGLKYWFGHLESSDGNTGDSVGSKYYPKGTPFATISAKHKTPHIHVGIDATPVLGKPFISGINYSEYLNGVRVPTVGQQLAVGPT